MPRVVAVVLAISLLIVMLPLLSGSVNYHSVNPALRADGGAGPIPPWAAPSIWADGGAGPIPPFPPKLATSV